MSGTALGFTRAAYTIGFGHLPPEVRLSQREGDSLLPERIKLHFLTHIRVCPKTLFKAAQLEDRFQVRANLNLMPEISTLERDTNRSYH
jgi:hypothetical protein